LIPSQSSAKDYWTPRRTIRPNDFQMDEDRRINSLDCLGPPFDVNVADLTHNSIQAAQSDLKAIYGGGPGIAPKISTEKLAKHGYDGWFLPNVEFHPFLPARPGWPGLILRLDDDLEGWEPDQGTEFRVVIRKEPHFLEYVGQYEMVRLGDIDGEEWRQQPTKVLSAPAVCTAGG
jgi:hypothetical protein